MFPSVLPPNLSTCALSNDLEKIAYGFTNGIITLVPQNEGIEYSPPYTNTTITALVFSPDSSMLAILLSDNNFKIFNINKKIYTSVSLRPFMQPVSTLCFTADSKNIILCYKNGNFTIWDISTSTIIQELGLQSQPIAFYAADIKRAKILLSDSVNIFDIKNLNNAFGAIPFHIMEEKILARATIEDKKSILYISKGHIIVVNTENKNIVSIHKHPSYRSNTITISAAFTANNKYILFVKLIENKYSYIIVSIEYVLTQPKLIENHIIVTPQSPLLPASLYSEQRSNCFSWLDCCFGRGSSRE